MSKFVNRFKVDEKNFDTIKKVLEYLDPYETISITYISAWYICEFHKDVYTTCDAFKDNFPAVQILSKK